MNGLDSFFALPTAAKIFIACLAVVQLTLAIVALVTLARTPDDLLPPIGRAPASGLSGPGDRTNGNDEVETGVAGTEASQGMTSRGNPSRRTRLLWAVIIILGELVGPIIFFIMRSRHARLMEELADDAAAVDGHGASTRPDASTIADASAAAHASAAAKVQASVSALYDDSPALNADSPAEEHQ